MLSLASVTLLFLCIWLDKIDAAVVREAFESFQLTSQSLTEDVKPIDSILSDAVHKERSLSALRYLQKKGLAIESSPTEPNPFMVFNGIVKFSTAEKYRETMMRSCLMGQHFYAQAVRLLT